MGYSISRLFTPEETDMILMPLAEDATNKGRAADSFDAFAGLIQCLDDRSLTLNIRDATNDGRNVFYST